MDMTPQTWPEWYDGRHINEVLFCQQFLDKHPMKCVRGRLFTVDGLIEDEGQIGNLILEEISGVLTSGLSKIVTNLLASMSVSAASGCVALWALRWSIRCHTKNEERTSKLPYTPYTLYGCF
jgi:putative DNA primase/helicase